MQGFQLFQSAKLPDNFLDEIRKKKLFSRYFLLTISLFISALSFNLLFLPTKIVAGGTGGLSIIAEHVFGWTPSIVIFVISIILLLFSFFFLGLEKTSGTVVATILYPLFVNFTAQFVNYIKIDTSDLILISIFGGLISGLTSGLMFKTGFSSGGLNIISQMLYKYAHVSISKSSFVINGIVVLIGGIYFGWTMVMYAVIVLYINSLMIDKVLLGVSSNKAFYIITSEVEEVKRYIIDNLKHSVTVFDVKGGYQEKKRKVLMAVVPSREYYRLTEGIKMLDQEVFFVVCDAYQVEGGA